MSSDDVEMVPDTVRLVIGLSLPQSRADATCQLHTARQDGFDFVATMLPHSLEPRPDVTTLESRWWRTSVVGMATSSSALGNSGISRIADSAQAVGGVYQAPQQQENDDIENRLPSQLQWAWHMGIPAVILPPIPPQQQGEDRFANYVRLVYTQSLEAPSQPPFQMWIPVSLTTEGLSQWQRLHLMCDQCTCLGILLVLEPVPAQLSNPNQFVVEQMQLLQTFLGLNIKGLAFPTSLFLTNKKGFPTLAKSHQIIVMHVLKRIGRTVRFLVLGPSVHNMSGQTNEQLGHTNCLPYLQYLNFLRKKPEVTDVLDSDEAQLEANYLDELQRPLQPLKDHLDFAMYETFEKDPVKYDRYQAAIYWALLDRGRRRQEQQHQSHSLDEIVVLVVGAGRGPLVNSTLKAHSSLLQQQQEANQQHTAFIIPALKVYAVEKNPSAVIYLQSLAQHDEAWKSAGVQVVQADLRSLSMEMLGSDKTADIVVSELLGSFGDNELSPECLDALYSTPVCRDDTVSIPWRYTAHLAPVSSTKLHIQARTQAFYPNTSSSGVIGMQEAMETPYVVRTHAVSQTHTEQDCWFFTHPSADTNRNRYVSLNFEPNRTAGAARGSGYGKVDDTILAMEAALASGAIGQDAGDSDGQSLPSSLPWTLTGLLGTFTADLHGSSTGSADGNSMMEEDTDEQHVHISTAPSSFSAGMFSWFPLYFPLKEAIHVPRGASVRVDMWRFVDGTSKRVWYEWSVTVHRDGEILAVAPLHNPGGRSYHVSM